MEARLLPRKKPLTQQSLLLLTKTRLNPKGMRPLPHIHIPFERIKDYLSFIKTHKLNLEIYLSAKNLDTLKDSDIKGLKNLLDYNPSITVHGPFMDLCPGAIDPKIRQITIDRFLRTLEAAAPFNPKAVVFHSGYEKWKYNHKPEIWLEGSLITWTCILKTASDINTKIAIENIFEDEPENLSLLMKEVGQEGFGLCLDTGHLNLFSKTPLSEWLKELMPYIIELHLHDNHKDIDSHLSIGEGTFNFKELFTSLNPLRKNLIYTIEAHTPEMVIKSINRFNEYLGTD